MVEKAGVIRFAAAWAETKANGAEQRLFRPVAIVGAVVSESQTDREAHGSEAERCVQLGVA